MQPIKKTEAYNPPTEYDTRKVFIVRIEQRRIPGKPGVFYSIVFRGSPEDLANDDLLMEQANAHLRHENLTGFSPVLPWEEAELMGNMSERTCTFRQITL